MEIHRYQRCPPFGESKQILLGLFESSETGEFVGGESLDVTASSSGLGGTSSYAPILQLLANWMWRVRISPLVIFLFDVLSTLPLSPFLASFPFQPIDALIRPSAVACTTARFCNNGRVNELRLGILGIWPRVTWARRRFSSRFAGPWLRIRFYSIALPCLADHDSSNDAWQFPTEVLYIYIRIFEEEY